LRGEIQNASGGWESVAFLVDTGADCTVFSAAILEVLGFDVTAVDNRLGGVGGLAESVEVDTVIRLPRNDGGLSTFRGTYAAFTQLESLDMCVLGRDIMNLFAVIVDRTDSLVTLVRPNHRYSITPS
jgi:predicted aspartyl protease